MSTGTSNLKVKLFWEKGNTFSQKEMITTTRYNRTQVRFAYSALLPIFFLYIVLRCWPIVQAFYLSFTDYSLIKTKVNFLGIQNYINLLTNDRDFVQALQNTLLFAVLTTVVALFLAFSITIIMDRRKIKGIGFLQSLIFLPVIVSVVPSAIIWKWMYDPQAGIFNYILSLFHIGSIGWLVDKRFSMYSIIFFVIWKWLGYYMVIFWVGLKGIPKLYLEAARIDGANEWSMIRHIVIPLLKPIMLFSLIMATINGFTIFSEVFVMTVGSQGAPGNMVNVLAYDIYERAFFYFKAGQANAEALILFLIVLLLTIVQSRFIRKGELY
jgi:multiple sugar transport system permease protein